MTKIEQTRAVIEAGEVFDGRIIPTKKAELERPVRIQEDATVDGSVYGNTVTLNDGATINESVMTSEAVELDGGKVGGDVGTPGKIEGNGGEVGGSITGARVRLTDCIVRGNVVGEQVILEGCVVLGLVSATESLALEQSLCYTFDANGQTTIDGGAMILPQAITTRDVTIKEPLRVAGLGTLELEETTERLPQLTTDDLYIQDEQPYLTLVPRLLNLEQVSDRLDELEHRVRRAVADTADSEGMEVVSEVIEIFGVDESTSIAALERVSG